MFTQKNLIASTQHHHPIEKRLQENEHSHQHFSFDNIHSTITTTSTTTIHQQLLNPLLSTTDTRTSSNIGADCLLHNRSQPPTETLTLPTNNQLPIFSTHQQTQQASISPSCLKVKTEHTNLPSPASSISSGSGYNINNNNNNSNTTLDLNQNYTESMHICPNIINETRMLESQPRASYTRVCSHETAPHSSNCEHQMGSPNQHNTLTRQNTLLHTPHHHHQQQMQQHQHQSSCQQDNIGTLSHMPTSPSSSGSSSCLYQGGTQQHQQISPSCGMTTLSHFSMSTANNSAINNNNNNNNNMICDNSSFASRSTATKSTPSINPWQNQTVNRLGQEQQPNQHKSQCMIHDNNNYTTAQQQQQQQQTTELTLQQHHSHVMPPSPQERAFRTYSPPEQQDRQFASSSFRSPEYGPPSVESHHSAQHYSTLQSPHQTQQQQQQQQQQQTFDGYGTPTSFDNGMDIKPDPYTLQTMRNASSMISPTSYDTHSHSMNTPPDSMNPPPALQSAHYMSHHSHHPSLNYGGSPVTGYPSNFPMHQSPELVPGAPMNTHPDMIHQQNYVDYQYQQQMFYSRENRRPRRIACTCPNCRDGENKTVTTKDGKQRKLHICHILGCGKEYGKTSHLRAHLRWHAGERPFACNWLFCNKRFTRSDELQRHRRTHTGDKRFECSVCLKKFMRSDHLSKHMKTHQSQQNKQNKEKVGVSGTIDNTNIDKHNNNNNNNNNKVSKVSLMGKQQSDLEKSKFMNSLGLPNSLNLQ